MQVAVRLLGGLSVTVDGTVVDRSAWKSRRAAQLVALLALAPAQRLNVIVRPLPGVGALGPEDMRGISEKSNSVLAEMGGDVQWLHSYVTDDKIFCVYIAPDEGRVREHATRGGFPAEAIRPVSHVIDPASGGR